MKRSRLAFNHNQTMNNQATIAPLRGIAINHNQTVVRSPWGTTVNHNHTLVRR